MLLRCGHKSGAVLDTLTTPMSQSFTRAVDGVHSSGALGSA